MSSVTAAPIARAQDAVALLKTAAAIVASRFTPAGHLAQLVTQEHRGNCPVRGCTPACIEAGEFMVAVDAYLTAHEIPEPQQRELWSEAS